MNKSAQAGIAHIGLIVGLVVLGVLGLYAFNSINKEQPANAASSHEIFSNLSAVLRQDSAIFNFSYSGSSPLYKIDISTSSNMKQNLNRNFGAGSSNPIIVNNPQSQYPPYQCGSTLYWIAKATDERSIREIKSAVQIAQVDCNPPSTPVPTPTAGPTSTPIPIPTPTPVPSTSPIATLSPTPIPTASCIAQTKPTTVTLQGADGTWCYDSDGNGNYTTAGNCVDNCSSVNDYCQADGTNRDGYCTGTWNGTSWNNVHCAFGGYVCSSFGKICSDGACR